MYISKYTKKIRSGDKVVDLGSGNDPHPKATVYVDYFEDDDTERDGAEFKKPESGKYVRWDLNKYPYPFKDKEFDFVIAAHIAEHLESPLSFCLEIQRIGKRGYIETPNKFYEQLYGWDFHKWYVYIEDGNLIFENIVERTFLGYYTRSLYHEKKDPEFIKLHDDNIDRLLTSFYWEDSFPFRLKYNVVNNDKTSKLNKYSKKIIKKLKGC